MTDVTTMMNSWIDNTIQMDHQFWATAFEQLAARGKTQAESMTEKYYFYGEIDDPREMLLYPEVTMEQIKCAGKTNWLRKENGEFITVGDEVIDDLIESDKLVKDRFPYHDTEYNHLDIEGKIAYRVTHQHVTPYLARTLVGDELEMNLFPFIYEFEVTEITNDPTDKPRPWTYTISAHDEAEARTELQNELRPNGSIICEGHRLINGKWEYCRISVIKNDIKLLNVISNDEI